MKLPTLSLLFLCGFVALCVAAPAPTPSPSPPSTEALSTNLTTTTTTLTPKRGENNCSPTGPKHCNFFIKTWMPILSAGFQHRWKVFDHTCKQIGGEDALRVDRSDFSLTSQLPYTIELHLSGGFKPSGHILYAGEKVDLKKMYCEDCESVMDRMVVFGYK
ncbi:hypothetical protein CkaCkLH20_07940 [Colletotrichum karsti]|uniref:Uncharacterized protein n=1 Tax=Colletotrichum karsti TaxID=1095194 RepID=A0A9P6I1M4_9PEZI|nr:uncharacterized protein CkaCkLH20_07940 [Colletotrichum karsti]KAF9874803.1 hypothetical protein CkaCkLH20_07940 [Colletotrichum karsti]